ncbi:MAG TPA: sulfotransferase domain-containing protein [Anaerolineae bacterium]
MSKLFSSSTKLRTRASKKLFQLSKQIYQLSGLADSNKKTVVFIVGCQRSGTTITGRVLGRDWQAKSYGEFSELTSQGTKQSIRLKPLPDVQAVIEKDKARIVVIKPLVESQNVDKLLAFFPRSKALWVYRHYEDVVQSSIKKFGPEVGIRDLRPIVEDDIRNWRAERVPESIREIVRTHFSELMEPYDAAALFWFVRNSLYFELNPAAQRDILLCKYEHLALYPGQAVRRIYNFLDHPFPGDRIVSNIHAHSVGKGQDTVLSPEVERLCSTLWAKLEQVYQSQAPHALDESRRSYAQQGPNLC